MDYVEVFQNLRTNNKYGRKSPHKAVLMLTLIELYEQNVLSENEILYDDTLKTTFLKVWNRVLPDEPLFHSEAYLPFWYLQSDSFWHIVPNRGKEDILSLMRDNNIKPSEAKLYDCVKYAELDEDLYFLMTLPSGRSSLKRVLLESYTNLADKQIERLSESTDNAIDYSVAALSEYEKIFSKENTESDNISVETDSELVHQFQMLNEELQIVLNLQYYSFLKSHRNERGMFKGVCPTVYDLLDKIKNHPVEQGDIEPSFAFTYESFLSDLKIALMSEDGAMDLIDKIGEAIDILQGNYTSAKSSESIVETKNTEPLVSIQEDISYGNEEDTPSKDYIIQNFYNRCSIIDNRGEQVFSSDGQLVRLKQFFYRVNYSGSLVSMNIVQDDNKGSFSLGRRILSAKSRTPLYTILDDQSYLKQFKAVKYDPNCDEYYVQVGDRWYGSSGYYADLDGAKAINSALQNQTGDHNIEKSKSKDAPARDDKYDYSDLEIEHVYLDSRGKVIEEKTSNEIVSEVNSTTESRKGKPWTQEEEELMTLYFQHGIETATIAEKLGRTEVAIKLRLAKLGLIEYTYRQEEQESVNKDKIKKAEEDEFTIENSFTRCSIINKSGERVFSAVGKLKYINGRLYRLNQKNECFTLKSMQFNGEVWIRGDKKIVAYPQTELYRIMEYAIDDINRVEDIVDSPVFEDCKLKVKGIWYKYNGELASDTKKEVRDSKKRDSDLSRVIKNPLYAVRRQAILRAMSFFRFPAKIRDIARTISRTAWGHTIKEEDVEDVIATMPEVDSIDGGYVLKKKK